MTDFICLNMKKGPEIDEILDWMIPDEDARAEYDEDGYDYDD